MFSNPDHHRRNSFERFITLYACKFSNKTLIEIAIGISLTIGKKKLLLSV